MRRKRSRAWRRVRVAVLLLLRKLTVETPAWLPWLAPWGTSLCAHAVALLTLGFIVYASSDEAPRPVGIESTLGPTQLVEDLTSLSPSDHAGDPFTTITTPEPASFSLEPGRSLATAVPESLLSIGPEAGQIAPPLSSALSAAQDLAGVGLSVPKDPAVPFSGRSAEVRAKIVRREGGTVESERGVALGLDWLARHQRKEGSWSLDHQPQCHEPKCPGGGHSDSDVAATGLGLLPLLGAGHSHKRAGIYQSNVQRGLDWLVQIQKEDGELFSGGGSNTRMYSHAIGTMALSEAYGVTRDPKLREPAQKAVRFIVAAQNPQDGGWRYNPGDGGDTSVFGWIMLALRSGQLAGLKVPGEVLQKAENYLDRAATDTKKMKYGYLPGQGDSPVMSAEALLIRQYLGWPRDKPELSAGVKAVAEQLLNDKQRNIYYWYYATQLLHNMQNLAWKDWNPRVRDGLLRMQTRGKGCDRGSWDPGRPVPDRWGGEAGRHFLTSMSLLTLEVYYRYLPLYQAEDPAIGVR